MFRKIQGRNFAFSARSILAERMTNWRRWEGKFDFLWWHRRPKLGMRFIKLCMRVELDLINCLKMVQNIKIKMSYLVVVVFFKRFYTNQVKTQKSIEVPQKHPERRTQIKEGVIFISLLFNCRTKSYRSHPKLGPPVSCVILVCNGHIVEMGSWIIYPFFFFLRLSSGKGSTE